MYRAARQATARRPNGLYGQNLVLFRYTLVHGVVAFHLSLPTAILSPLLIPHALLQSFNFSHSASELDNKIAYQCLQLHGGAGYLADTPIAQAYLDARIQTIYGGSNEVLKDLIARQILAPARK